MLHIFESADPYLANGHTLTARQLLDRAVIGIERDLVDHPPTHAQMLTTMAVSYQTLGHRALAKDLLLQAKAILEKADHQASAVYGSVVYYLADEARQARDFEAAAQGYQQALDVFARHLPQDSLKQGMVLANLALVTTQEGDLAAALPYFDDAVSKLNQAGTPEARVVLANLWDRLGKAHADVGRYREAEVYFRRALGLKERLHHSDHPGIANVLNNLGRFFTKTGPLQGSSFVLRAGPEVNRGPFRCHPPQNLDHDQ